MMATPKMTEEGILKAVERESTNGWYFSLKLIFCAARGPQT